MFEKIFEDIGLSANERQVYLALLEIGDSTRTNIVKKTGIAGSKIYDVLERLKNKGLVGIYIHNNTKHFKPLNPKQLLNYLDEKEKTVQSQKVEIEQILPILTTKFLENKEEQEVELIAGLKAVHLYFEEQIAELKKGEYNYVIGGTKGNNDEHIIAFFKKIHRLREEKGIKTKMLYNTRQKKTARQEYGTEEFPNSETRYIEHTSAVAINIHNNKTFIIIFGNELTGVKITSQDVANSFLEYFNLLWKTAGE